MSKERTILQLEIAELESILLQIPHENIIDRLSFARRLEEAKENLARLNKEAPSESLVITFSGAPVRERHGILAGFAAEATSKLSDIYTTLVAISKGFTLGRSGAIPEAEKHQLLITGTAVGSFGFTMELPEEEVTPPLQLSLLEASTGVKKEPCINARDLLENVLEIAFNGSDEQFTRTLQETDKRVIDKVREFYNILQAKNAFYTLTTSNKTIRCSTAQHVERAVTRLKKANISEEKLSFCGHFTGYLPLKRDFEFITDVGEKLCGKVDRRLHGAESINKNLEQTVRIMLRESRLGDGKPRYTLIDYQPA